MSQLDRYIIRQMLGPFAFFLLIFGGIIWLNQSLRIIDMVVDNGQSGLVFIQMSSLLLPRILSIAVPISAFAAAVYLTNRLYRESELIVMMGAGLGPLQIIKPFFIFGLLSLLLMSCLTHFLMPGAAKKTQTMRFEIQKEFIAQIIAEGAFISPDPGITFFFGHTGANGDLEDIFIDDRSKPGTTVTHSAHKGQLVPSGDGAKLLLFNGVIQRYLSSGSSLNIINFDSLSYDLAPFTPKNTKRKIRLEEQSTNALFTRAASGSNYDLKKNQ